MSNRNVSGRCLLCAQHNKVMISLQDTMTGCEFSLAQVLEQLHFLTISNETILQRALCYICVAKIQSCFKLKMMSSQTENELKTDVSSNDIKLEGDWSNGFETIEGDNSEYYNCSMNVDTDETHQKQTQNSYRKEATCSSTQNSFNLNQCCCRRLEKLESEIGDLKSMVTSIYTLLASSKQNLSNVIQFPSVPENEFDFKFQINSLEQFAEFEAQLSNAAAATQYNRMVLKIGGDSYRKHIRRALNMTFTNLIAYQMSWSGLRNTFGIKDKIFVSIIKESIKLRWNVDETAVEQVFKSWFQHAGDRLKPNLKPLGPP